MNQASESVALATAHQLFYKDLLNTGRSFAFPCDAQGRVDMDVLSERGRNNYLYARALVGKDLAFPSVQPVPPSRDAGWKATQLPC